MAAAETAGPQKAGPTKASRRIESGIELWFAVEEGVVEEAGEEAAKERPDPIDTLIGPVICGNGRTKGAGWIKSAARKGAGDENAECDDEADAEAGVRAGGVTVVDGGGEDREDEKERGDGFEDKAGEDSEVSGEGRSSEGDALPGFLGDDGFEKKCSRDGASDLRGPIGDGFDGGDALGDPEPDRDGGIKVAAGDVAERTDH